MSDIGWNCVGAGLCARPLKNQHILKKGRHRDRPLHKHFMKNYDYLSAIAMEYVSGHKGDRHDSQVADSLLGILNGLAGAYTTQPLKLSAIKLLAQ